MSHFQKTIGVQNIILIKLNTKFLF